MRINIHPPIVVVDDDETVGWMIQRFLTIVAHTYPVQTFTRGEDALVFLERNQVFCVFTDYAMPEMDGLALAHKIRDRWPDLPIILMTGSDLAAVEANAKDVGCSQIILKPVLPATIQSAITSLLSAHAAGQ